MAKKKTLAERIEQYSSQGPWVLNPPKHVPQDFTADIVETSRRRSSKGRSLIARIARDIARGEI
jgi:hypothetical protein